MIVRSLGWLGVALALTVGCKEQKREDPTKVAFTEFAKRVDDFVALRAKLADSVGVLDETKSQAEIADRATRLAKSLIAARSTAKQGDLFTPEAATIFATLIKQENSRRPAPVKETRQDQQDELPDFVPQVNQIYPTTYPLATFPPTLLPVLPSLPKEIEYRIVTHYLILRDVEANLILDFMPHAVP